MNALMIYGQLRTFKQCIPTILNYIDYDNKEYDIFLFIDTNNDSNYSEKNIEILQKMFNKNKNKHKNNIKLIKYTNTMSSEEINCENNLSIKYNNICQNIKKHFNLNNVVTNKFVSKLYYRRQLLISYVNEYCYNNNIHYDNCVLTRFDIKLHDEKFMFKNELSIIFDIFFSGNLLMLSKIFQFTFEYFAMYDICLTQNLIFLDEIINNLHGYKLNHDELLSFYKQWLCMPELNFKVYLISKNIKFNDIPCDPKYICRQIKN